MQDNRKKELAEYRMHTAEETLTVAKELLDAGHYKDSINRAYYAAFYAVRAVLAVEGVDFKRHKDVIAYFNKCYIAAGQIEKSCGRKLAQLQQKREKSDYDDFFLTSKEEAERQYEFAAEIIEYIRKFLI